MTENGSLSFEFYCKWEEWGWKWEIGVISFYPVKTFQLQILLLHITCPPPPQSFQERIT